MPSHWLGYVHVSSVDDTLAAALAAGGKVVKPGTNIPDIGRFGIFFDDLGAATCAFCPTSEGKSPAPPKVGEFCWESINTPDVAKSIAFYTQVYGWKTSPFGPDMTTFGLGDGMANQIASITPAPAGGARALAQLRRRRQARARARPREAPRRGHPGRGDRGPGRRRVRGRPRPPAGCDLSVRRGVAAHGADARAP
jgi:predicted enzyme related to lactoylglutathione lyase